MYTYQSTDYIIFHILSTPVMCTHWIKGNTLKEIIYNHLNKVK